jgi:tetratricopeptide (TPR) repeat protein
VTAEVLETLEIREQDDSMKLAAGLLSQLGWANALLGETEPALNQLERSLQLLEENADPFPLAHGQMEAGHSMLVMGSVDKAIEFLELARATKEANALYFDTLEWTYPMLARAYLEKAGAGGDAESWRNKARKAVKRSHKLVKRHTNYRSAALLNQGLLDWSEGRRDDALAAFDDAIAVARTQGAQLMLAEAHLEAGRCWADVDEARARQHLRPALELFEDRGMEPYAERCRILLGSMGDPAGRPAAP